MLLECENKTNLTPLLTGSIKTEMIDLLADGDSDNKTTSTTTERRLATNIVHLRKEVLQKKNENKVLSKPSSVNTNSG